MEVTLEMQVGVFIGCAIGGCMIGLLYDVFRIARRITPANAIVTLVEDTLFWIISTFILFYVILYLNNGDVRMYQFWGAIAGAAIYLVAISPFVISITMFIYKVISFIIIKLLRLLFYPIRLILRLFRKPVIMAVAFTKTGAQRTARRARKTTMRMFSKVSRLGRTLKFVRKI